MEGFGSLFHTLKEAAGGKFRAPECPRLRIRNLGKVQKKTLNPKPKTLNQAKPCARSRLREVEFMWGVARLRMMGL